MKASEVDQFQFARLLAEINAAGLDEETLETLCESMNCDQEQIRDTLDRAEKYWETLKTIPKEPAFIGRSLNLKEAKSRVDDDGYIEGVVEVDLGDAIDNDLEGFLDLIGERLVEGGTLLMDSSYSVFGQHGNKLFLTVSGDASMVISDDDEQ